jgi:hypothetical protein
MRNDIFNIVMLSKAKNLGNAWDFTNVTEIKFAAQILHYVQDDT